jgi:hypothetical protein
MVEDWLVSSVVFKLFGMDGAMDDISLFCPVGVQVLWAYHSLKSHHHDIVSQHTLFKLLLFVCS